MGKIREFFKKIENAYLVVALIAGGIFVFFNPPFEGVPDEGAHFYRAWGVSQGDVICSKKLNGAALNLPEELKPYKVNGSNDEKISLGKIKKALFEKDSKQMVAGGSAVCGSNPLGYLPQAIGISVSKIFNLPVLWGFYFARFFSMFAAVFITYLALRLIPFGKIVILLIALLPMTMQQYASLSYDALHISMIFLFTAYVLKLSVGEGKLSKREMILLALSAIAAANIKFGFLPVLLLLFIMPWKRFGSKKNFWLYVIGTIFISFLIVFVAQKSAVGSEGAREGVYPIEQIWLIIKNPFVFLYAVINTLYSGAEFFFETFLYKPGWLKNQLSPLFYIFLFLGLIILMRSSDEKVMLSKKQRWILGLTSIASLLFVFFSMYVLWSKVGGDKVQGVQGRYFLSTFPLLLLAFYKSGFRFGFDRIKKHLNVSIIIFFTLIFASVVVSIWNIYYDNTQTDSKYEYVKYISKEDVASLKTDQSHSELRQTFVADKNNLQGIKLYIEKGIYSGKANFFLKDENCEKTLRKKDLSWDKDEFGSIQINFGLTAESEGERYCMEASFSDIAIPFKVSEGVYGKGEASIDGQPISGDLVFDLVYKN